MALVLDRGADEQRADGGAHAPLSDVRESVLVLRRRKGMVIDPDDPDSVSAGSFFVNPILSREEFTALERKVSKQFGPEMKPPRWPEADGRMKTSAAWLIERAGFHRGYGEGRVGVSNKHTLALVNVLTWRPQNRPTTTLDRSEVPGIPASCEIRPRARPTASTR